MRCVILKREWGRNADSGVDYCFSKVDESRKRGGGVFGVTRRAHHPYKPNNIKEKAASI